MSNLLFSNNAQTTLASGLTNVALSMNLAPGSGVLFPVPTGIQYFLMTLVDAATGLINEIVKVTNITGDIATIVRAQEGTTAKAWLAGDIVVNMWTAGSAQAMAQNTDLQNNAYSYSLDTGAANAYIGAYTPAVTTLVDGMVLRVKAAHVNTGASTFTPNTGTIAAAAIVGNGNAALTGGEIIANGDMWLQWNTSVGSPGSWCMVATATAYALKAGSSSQAFACASLTSAGAVTGTNLFGQSQTVTDEIGAGRGLANTTYSNTTARPVQYWVTQGSSGSPAGANLLINGTAVAGTSSATTEQNLITFISNPGESFRVNTNGGGFIPSWFSDR